MTFGASAIVIFALATGEPRLIALLEYPYQLALAAYRPEPGEGRVQMERSRFEREYMVTGLPSPDLVAGIIAEAAVRLAANPTVCLEDVQ